MIIVIIIVIVILVLLLLVLVLLLLLLITIIKILHTMYIYYRLNIQRSKTICNPPLSPTRGRSRIMRAQVSVFT